MECVEFLQSEGVSTLVSDSGFCVEIILIATASRGGDHSLFGSENGSMKLRLELHVELHTRRVR